MASTKKVRRTRRRFYYLSTIVSITLVLFLLGAFGFVMLNVNKLTDSFRENFEVHVLFLDDAREADIQRLASEWENKPAITNSRFTHKDEAKEDLIEDLGEDFVEFLGYNPLPHTVDLFLQPDYVNPDSLQVLSKRINDEGPVKEVLYNELVAENLERNIQVAGIILLGLAFIFMLITIALINSTIRLTMFSRRFLIKSMQLVGATKGFIQKPFLLKALYHGFLGGIFANLMLAGIVYYMYLEFPQYVLVLENGDNINYNQLFFLGMGIIVTGMVISLISSYFAVNKYLKMKLDDLY